MTITVEIYKNRMTLSRRGQQVTVYPPAPYTTTRLIIGTFKPAVACLKAGLKKLSDTPWYLFSPGPDLQLIIKEMAEGGLSQVEEACLMELGKQAGARKVEIRC